VPRCLESMNLPGRPTRGNNPRLLLPARPGGYPVVFPACGSVLLLGITNHLTQNVAAIPFLWVLPLSLYILSFTLAFSGPAFYPRAFFLPLVAVATLGMEILFVAYSPSIPYPILLAVFSTGLFAGCMVCHGELARMAPDPRYLTGYYLAIAAGGAVGGVFVGIAAPLFFRTTYELPLGILACAILALAASVLLLVACGSSIAIAAFPVFSDLRPPQGLRLIARNFFGVLKVVDDGPPGGWDSVRNLTHGSVNHGSQFTHPARRRTPVTYYHPNSGIGLALRSRASSAPLRVGIIGLGAGVLAAYGRPGDVYRFYEINPLVIRIAETDFSYLRDSGAKVEVALGDARLSMEREPEQLYDVFVIDAFSGDAIPIHLLTQEALRLYLRNLKKDGLLAFHISNHYIDLKPVIRRMAEQRGMAALAIKTEGNSKEGATPAEWVLLSAARETLEKRPILGAGNSLPSTPTVRTWTDDYSSLFPLLK
jgi:SAM-dependent methyltransferase